MGCCYFIYRMRSRFSSLESHEGLTEPSFLFLPRLLCWCYPQSDLIQPPQGPSVAALPWGQACHGLDDLVRQPRRGIGRVAALFSGTALLLLLLRESIFDASNALGSSAGRRYQHRFGRWAIIAVWRAGCRTKSAHQRKAGMYPPSWPG